MFFPIVLKVVKQTIPVFKNNYQRAPFSRTHWQWLPLQHTSHAWVLEGCQNQVFILFCDDTCPDYPNQKHENHAHGERVEDQRVHDSDASLIGSVVRKQLVHLILAPLDAE
jgi:hypothetical protein